MAKYRKSKKRKASHTTHRRRHRRVGAMSLSASSPLIKFAPIVAGWFFSDKINGPIETAVGTKVDSKLIAGAEAGIGYLLAFKGKKSTVKSIAGGLLIGAGIKKLLTEFGIVSGFRSVPVLGTKRLGAYNNVPVVGSTPSVLSAYQVPPVMNGYNVPGKRNVMNGCANGSGINSDSR